MNTCRIHSTDIFVPWLAEVHLVSGWWWVAKLLQERLSCSFYIFWTSWNFTLFLVNKQTKLVQQTHFFIYLFKEAYFTVMPWREHHSRFYLVGWKRAFMCMWVEMISTYLRRSPFWTVELSVQSTLVKGKRFLYSEVNQLSESGNKPYSWAD